MDLFASLFFSPGLFPDFFCTFFKHILLNTTYIDYSNLSCIIKSMTTINKKLICTILALSFMYTTHIFAANHFNGREGLINGPTKAERIVVTFPMSVGLLYICDLANNIVGMQTRTMHLHNQKFGEFYQTISPKLAETTDIGAIGASNIETVLRLSPDLVMTQTYDSSVSAMINVLNKNKVPVLMLQASNGSVTDWLRTVEVIGEATGRKSRTDAYIKHYEDCLNLVKSRVANIPLNSRPKVALVNTNRGNMILRGSRTRFLYDLMERAGAKLMERGEDPADSGACAEILFAFDPDIIIDDSRSNEFYNASWWNLLKPVKENKVYLTPQDDPQAWVTNWSQPTYSALGLLWLAKIIHPETFKDIDLKKEHDKFCKLMYGRTLSHHGTAF